MSSITKPISIVSSLPSLFTSFSKSPSLISFPTKPINFSLSSSNSSASLKLKSETHFSSLVAFSDGQDQQVLVEQGEEEPKWENDESDGAEASWGPEGEGEEAVFDEQTGDSEEEVPEPSEEAKLFVGNLPFDVDSQSLAMLFEKAGTVEIAEVIYNRDTRQSRGFGFVTMSSVEEAEKGAELFNRYDLNGRLLTVNKSAPRGSRVERPPRVYEPSFRVYVGNLPWDVDNGRLEQIFSEHGKVVDARVVFDRESGRSRGFGFVTMSSETELNDAIAALDGQSLDGRPLRVNVAEERPRRGGFF